jgi:threonine dehydrogenase-like Zn-dependent dehydrogenase
VEGLIWFNAATLRQNRFHGPDGNARAVVFCAGPCGLQTTAKA